MGKKAGNLVNDCLYQYDWLFKLKERALESMRYEGCTSSLPKTAFIIEEHYTAVSFFLTDSKVEDPPIFGLNWIEDKIIQISNTFSNWLKERIEFSKGFGN